MKNISSVNIDLSPEKKEYMIGDTIVLGTEFGTLLPLTNSNETIAIDNGVCNLNLFVMKLGNEPGNLVGFTDFDFINFSGDLNQDEILDEIIKRYQGEIAFNCNANKCEFKIGLVPKVKGNYCLALYIGEIRIQDTSICPVKNVLYDNKFNVSSHNREIFQELSINYSIQLPSSSSTGYWDIIENDGAFAFKVK